MKVLYFHQHFTTPEHAGGTRSYEFAKKLIKKGHSVCMVCGDNGDLKLEKVAKNMKRGFVDGIEIIQILLPYSNNDNLLKRTKIFLQYALVGVKIALKGKYDLIFATSTPLTAGIPAIFGKIFRGKKFVFEVRDLWPDLPKALGFKNPTILFLMRCLEVISYRLSSACIGLSPGICEGIKKRSQKNKKVSLIPNACDLELFNPNLKTSIELNGITKNDKIVIFAGAHGKANGLDAILDMAEQLRNFGRTDIKVIFIGNGNMKASLVKRAKKENLTNCHFFNPIPKKELRKILASADIGLMVLANVEAFYYGTSPNKFFDYIASGLPVVNNYPGWLAGLITKNKCGIAVEPCNSFAFANAVIKIIDNDELKHKYGKNSRLLAEREFNRDELSDKFVKFLQNV